MSSFRQVAYLIPQADPISCGSPFRGVIAKRCAPRRLYFGDYPFESRYTTHGEILPGICCGAGRFGHVRRQASMAFSGSCNSQRRSVPNPSLNQDFPRLLRLFFRMAFRPIAWLAHRHARVMANATTASKAACFAWPVMRVSPMLNPRVFASAKRHSIPHLLR